MNDRLHMPSAMPAELAERLSDRGVSEFTDEDKAEARLEIADAIMEKPKGWKGHTLFSTLQEYLNADSAVYDTRLAEIAKHIRHMLYGDEADRPAPLADRLLLARADAETFFRGTVEDYIEQEWVEERAAEIAGERLELAS